HVRDHSVGRRLAVRTGGVLPGEIGGGLRRGGRDQGEGEAGKERAHQVVSSEARGGVGASLPTITSSRPTARKEAMPVRLPRNRRSTASSLDRKSTRLNSTHVKISYAVFCL